MTTALRDRLRKRGKDQAETNMVRDPWSGDLVARSFIQAGDPDCAAAADLIDQQAAEIDRLTRALADADMAAVRMGECRKAVTAQLAAAVAEREGLRATIGRMQQRLDEYERRDAQAKQIASALDKMVELRPPTARAGGPT